MAETLYEGPAHNATFYVRSVGIVRFDFSVRAAGYGRSRYGALARVESQVAGCSDRPASMF